MDNAGAQTSPFRAGIQRRLWSKLLKSQQLSAHTAYLESLDDGLSSTLGSPQT
ncbi:hypothetical protein SAMN04487948_1561, partial [Halogranum amylolyticum]